MVRKLQRGNFTKIAADLSVDEHELTAQNDRPEWVDGERLE